MFTIESLGTGSAGRMVRATDDRATPRDLPFDSVVDALREYGALLFRGFGAASSDFATFTDRFARATLGRLHLGQNRREVPDDENTSTVNLGMHHVGPHAELGYSPQRPDLLWFYCARPPDSGGETTLFDGIEVWRRLPEPLREKCATTDIVYSFDAAGREDWPLFTGVPADRDRTLELLPLSVACSYTISDKDTISISYRVSAAKPSRFQGVPAFANSIIPNLSGGVTFADGTPVRSGDRLSILRTCNEVMTPIAWQQGDIVMIDNSRTMHVACPFPTRPGKFTSAWPQPRSEGRPLRGCQRAKRAPEVGKSGTQMTSASCTGQSNAGS
ncbi:TauD/TfdA family dioxygenase [Salinispora arenicola]|uniref:TauD/TfdA family dioxygenase n=1 Tax=Salinispora arenicola TaxID=168697 RepID=UPI0027DC274B|nr:TauD/TfdA family dioxygenase [Salinispora arenicola]